MAEYYPLLARAIAGLPQSTPESRRAIYERARTALIGQLRAVQPPIADVDIERESRLLDEAIARLENEAEGGGLTAPPPAASSGSAASEGRKPAEPLARRPDAPLLRPSTAPRPGLPPRPNLPPRPGASPGERPVGFGALEAARQRLATLSKPGGAALRPPLSVQSPKDSKPAPEKPSFAKPAGPGPVEPASGSRPASQPGLASSPEAPRAPTEAEVAASRLAAEGRPERREGAGPINITLRKYGPRAEAAGVSADFKPESQSAVEHAGDEETPRGGARPAAPLPPEEKERNLRPLLIGLPIALVVGAIAIFAYVRRDNPEDLARLRPAPGSEAPAEQSGKIVERIGGGQAARSGGQPAQQQAPQGQQQAAQQGQQPGTGAPAIPVSQRAALLVDAPDEPQRVRTFVGNVVWRLDNVSRGPGQPLAIGVRAEIDLPEAKLRAVVLLQKNTDETLPASHTIEVRFMPAEGGPIPGVAQISTPQMRKEDTPAGDGLVGVPAQILRNFFLVGLTRGDASVSRNIDLIRTRGWIDIPMLLSDQRIAKITFEKGTAGDRIINEAFEAWK